MHAFPHWPQFCELFCRLVQVPLQLVGALAGHAHAPAWHVMPPLHAFPQLPQWELLVFVLVSQLVEVVTQFLKGALQEQFTGLP